MGRGSREISPTFDRKKWLSSLLFQVREKGFSFLPILQAPAFQSGANPKSKIQNLKSIDFLLTKHTADRTIFVYPPDSFS
jgi:hypothetical protein